MAHAAQRSQLWLTTTRIRSGSWSRWAYLTRTPRPDCAASVGRATRSTPPKPSPEGGTGVTERGWAGYPPSPSLEPAEEADFPAYGSGTFLILQTVIGEH